MTLVYRTLLGFVTTLSAPAPGIGSQLLQHEEPQAREAAAQGPPDQDGEHPRTPDPATLHVILAQP